MLTSVGGALSCRSHHQVPPMASNPASIPAASETRSRPNRRHHAWIG